MKRLALATSALALLAAAVPALAEDEPEVVLHEACAAPAGALVVVPGTPATTSPTTPVGALNEAVVDSPERLVVVDLAGRPDTTTANLELTLSWDNPVTADYDLVTDGQNDLSTDDPETKVLRVRHCVPVRVDVEVFVGLPTDTLTLGLSARPFPAR
jgi:hypothetical protein